MNSSADTRLTQSSMLPEHSSFSGALPEHTESLSHPPFPQSPPRPFPVCHWPWSDLSVCPLLLAPAEMLDEGSTDTLSLSLRTQEATTFRGKGRAARGEAGEPERTSRL